MFRLLGDLCYRLSGGPKFYAHKPNGRKPTLKEINAGSGYWSKTEAAQVLTSLEKCVMMAKVRVNRIDHYEQQIKQGGV